MHITTIFKRNSGKSYLWTICNFFLTYALSFYGLIPEKVETVTSITNNRNKFFATGVGNFQYYYLHPQKYAVGIVLNTLNKHQNILIASPEKALCDQILSYR